MTTSDGIREFVVGTGGRNLKGFSTIRPNSVAEAKVFGVLEMTLGSAEYSLQFRTESGGTFSDSGTAACNGEGTDPPPTDPPPTEPTPTSTSCYGVASTIEGTKSADTLTGTSGADVITGLAGNDIVDGGDGNDLICTAGGADQVNGGAGNDRVSGGAAADTLTDLSGADVLEELRELAAH